MLSEQEEWALIRRAADGDGEAMDALVLPCQPLIHGLARRFCCSRDMTMELVQAGNLGLMAAITHFERGHHAHLTTYAVPWILGEMKKCLKREERDCISLEQTHGDDQTPLRDQLQGTLGIDIERMNLRIALQKLSEEARKLIILRYYRGYTQKESALLLGKSQTQISRDERRTLDMLAAWLS